MDNETVTIEMNDQNLGMSDEFIGGGSQGIGCYPNVQLRKIYPHDIKQFVVTDAPRLRSDCHR